MKSKKERLESKREKLDKQLQEMDELERPVSGLFFKILSVVLLIALIVVSYECFDCYKHNMESTSNFNALYNNYCSVKNENDNLQAENNSIKSKNDTLSSKVEEDKSEVLSSERAEAELSTRLHWYENNVAMITPDGHCYHKLGCSTLGNSDTFYITSISQAISEGYDACNICEK